MTRKCPFMSGVLASPKNEIGGLAFTSIQVGKAIYIECIGDDCMAWQELANSNPDFVDTRKGSIGYCKLIDRKCH
jgi:hypothetical protein